MRLNAVGDRIQLIHAGAESARNHLQKTPGSGGTFIIHQKVGEITVVIQLNNLAVLAANVDDRAGFRSQKARPQPVAGDFRHLFIGKINQLASVAG